MRRIVLFVVLALVGGGIATALVMSGGAPNDAERETTDPAGLVNRALGTPEPSPTPTPTPAPVVRSGGGGSAPAPTEASTSRTRTRAGDDLDGLPTDPIGQAEDVDKGKSSDDPEPDDFEAQCRDEGSEAERDACEDELEDEFDEEQERAELEADRAEALDACQNEPTSEDVEDCEDEVNNRFDDEEDRIDEEYG